MKKIEHPLFSFEVPDTFDQQLNSEIIAWARSSSIPHKVQPHFVRLNVEELKDLDSHEIKGNTLAEKMVHYYLNEESQGDISAVEELLVDGRKTLAMTAKVNTTVAEKEFSLHYLFAVVLLDEYDFISFSALHEITPDGLLEDWVMETLKSVKVLSDANARAAAYEAYEKRFSNFADDIGVEENSDAEEVEAKKTAFMDVEVPKDGKEVFQVGDFNFEFISEETNMTIGKLSKELFVTIKAKTSEITNATKAELLDDYKKDGMVTLTIPAKGIHKNGMPIGSVYFEEEKTNAPLFLNARSEGFDYRLAFTGSVTFEAGWLLLKGEMTKSYHNKSIPIHICKKMDSAKLKWSDYRFSSMEETETAKPEDVRFLILNKPEFSKLPDAIFTFVNLESLTLSDTTNYYEKIPLRPLEIQSEIGKLKHLNTLRLNGFDIKELPDSISELKELEQLSVNNCNLERIPEGVFQLSKLKYLWLSRNLITKLPETINLPSLQNIYLDGNQFKTLPEALATQPKLNKIDLEGNTLERLPASFNQVKEIKMSMEDKLRLLDFGYEGADGKGLISWNDEVFWSKTDTDLLPEIKQVIKENKLEAHETALTGMVKKSVGFRHSIEEDYSEIGNHRFGGMPDLPKDMEYPRFGENWREDKIDYVYEFLGQINCAEIAHLQDYLPRTGMLFFFLETIHSVYGGNENPCKVVYVEDNKHLKSGKRFQFTRDDYSEMYEAAYTGFKVDANKINSAPSFYASYVNTHLFKGEGQKLMEDDQLLDALYDTFERPINEKNNYQYLVNAHGFTQHEAPELQASLVKKGNPEDWMTLLVVTSAGDMQWGDAGDLFFLIHKSDLAKGDFSNVFVTMESS